MTPLFQTTMAICTIWFHTYKAQVKNPGLASNENPKTIYFSTMPKFFLIEPTRKQIMVNTDNLTKRTKILELCIEHVITFIIKYIYNKGRSRVATKNFGQCRNMWRKKNGTKPDVLGFLHYPQIHEWKKRRRKNNFHISFWPSGKSEWFNIYNYSSKI